jgi:hypothetical protein
MIEAPVRSRGFFLWHVQRGRSFPGGMVSIYATVPMAVATEMERMLESE